jgi:ketosteroid isomerase-like protein
MYHMIVGRIVRNGFDQISAGNYQAVLSQCVPNVIHEFAGRHALGGVRHDRDTLTRWFERLERLLPGFKLEITDLAVKGMPWDTTAIIQWTGRSTMSNGHRYVQHGVHFLTLRWGRVHAFRIYVDTQELAQALEALGRHGIAEACAEPIVS